MATSSPPRRTQLVDNAIWLGASIFLAVIVWITAELNTNPIVEDQPEERVEIEVLVDDDMVVTSQSQMRAFVVVRAQESSFDTPDLLNSIRIVADARNITESGQRRLTLEGRVEDQSHVTVAEIIPAQITVQLEPRAERLVQLRSDTITEPPASFAVDIDMPDINEVLIAGPADRVELVDEALLQLDLASERESVELELEPVLFNLEQGVISGLAVTIEPAVIPVTVNIEPRSDVREVRVSPNFVNELPEGYTITSSFAIQPETAFVTGPPDTLANLPSTLPTETIDLSQYTNDFEIRVPLRLPDDDLIVITGQQITVSVGIEPIQTSRQFESIAIDAIGLRDGLTAVLSPTEVGVLVNGPQPVLSTLQSDDVQVLVDLNSIAEPGTYSVIPIASASTQIVPENIEVLPPTIDVQVIMASEATGQ
ncbi:MAG: CdaR family protein [Chloroflexota bacterium]